MIRFLTASLVSIFAAVAVAATPTPLDLAKQVTQAIEKSDNAALAALLVGAKVPKNFAKGTTTLATEEAALEWIERGPGLQTKGGEKCAASCCTWDENGGNGWGDVPSHPHKICFANGKAKTVELTRGGQ